MMMMNVKMKTSSDDGEEVAKGSPNQRHHHHSDCLQKETMDDGWSKQKASEAERAALIVLVLVLFGAICTGLWFLEIIHPSSVPTKPTRAKTGCFESSSQLKQAVAEWFESSDLQESVESTFGPISEWCFTSAVTDMSNLFEGRQDFNQDISLWDVSSVTDMHRMFYGASSFNRDLSS